MKARLLKILLFITILTIYSCATKKYNLPTHTYSYIGKDSILLSKHSINIDSLLILVIDMTNTTDKTTSPEIENHKVQNANFIPLKVGVNNVFSGSSFTSLQTNGEMEQNRLLNQISISRVIQNLKSLTNVYTLRKKSSNIKQYQMDSIIKRHDADLLIVADSVHYEFNQELSSATHVMDKAVAPSDMDGYMLSSENRSAHTVVRFYSSWSLIWLDPSTHSISKRQKVVQKGQIHATDEKSPEAAVMSCALKIGDEFTSIFYK